jgi:hypothetical protein
VIRTTGRPNNPVGRGVQKLRGHSRWLVAEVAGNLRWAQAGWARSSNEASPLAAFGRWRWAPHGAHVARTCGWFSALGGWLPGCPGFADTGACGSKVSRPARKSALTSPGLCPALPLRSRQSPRLVSPVSFWRALRALVRYAVQQRVQNSRWEPYNGLLMGRDTVDAVDTG